MLQFKSWGNLYLKHLNIKKETNCINDDILSKWTTDEFKTMNEPYLASTYVASRWAKQAGFVIHPTINSTISIGMKKMMT